MVWGQARLITSRSRSQRIGAASARFRRWVWLLHPHSRRACRLGSDLQSCPHVRTGPDALDAGCGTGFLSYELATRGHRVTGVDFAPAMLAEAQRKATEGSVSIRFEQADAEQLPFPPASFDLAISRHVLWTLPHPEAAIDEWIRVLHPGGRLVVIDGQFDPNSLIEPSQNARNSAEYAAIGDRLPFLGGRPREEIEALLAAHGLIGVRSDPVRDLVEAQAQRMVEEGRERQTRRRYVAWGDVPR